MGRVLSETGSEVYAIMSARLEVAPRMISWARERAGLTVDDLAGRFKRLQQWEMGAVKPTIRQLQDFARATHTPVGYLFLGEPPVETLPVTDFRRMPDAKHRTPSPDLLDMLYLCQQRQEWYRDFASSYGERPVELVGSATTDVDPSQAAARARLFLNFEVDDRADIPTWSEGLRVLRQRAEDAGILVMISGIVGSNTHRKLDPAEFRGFALSDVLAPLIFVNGTDTKAAQIFTVAHEIGHLVLGESGVSNPQPASSDNRTSERWCNAFAAELLVPIDALSRSERTHDDLTEEIKLLARRFKVSTLVVLLRVHDAGWITRQELRTAYQAELERVKGLEVRGGGGGDFYNTLPVRVSERFARAVVSDTLEGQTLYRDAFRMLGFRNQATFDRLTVELGMR